MHLWDTSYDPKTRGHKHVVRRGFGHALLAPLATTIFSDLRISAAVWEHGEEWMPIHGEPGFEHLEFEYGRESDRGMYNNRCIEDVQRDKETVLGQNGRFFDFFVPISRQSKVVGVLVAGSFLAAPLSTAELNASWHALAGRKGDLSDPGFAAYFSAAMSLLVLDENAARRLGELLGCLATLMAGEGRADELMNRVEVLRAELVNARFAERVWELMPTILAEQSTRSPHSAHLGNLLRDFGLTKITDHVLVGLTMSRGSGADSVEEAVRRHRFQRESVSLARRAGHAIAGRVGSHGVVFLSGSTGSASMRRRKAVDLADRAAALGGKLGLALHFGVSAAAGSLPMRQSYLAALAAAESARAQSKRLLFSRPELFGDRPSLSSLRRELGAVTAERPELFAAWLERYLEAVALECDHRVDLARVHLSVGLERITDALQHSAMLEERSARAMSTKLDRATAGALNVSELLSAYRRALSEISESAKRPAPARRDRNLRGAIEYIHAHYAETLSRDKVARVAGFAPGYFSELFKKRERVSFERYLLRLRIERAKQLLDGTDLEAKRIAELSGFQTPRYFSHAFRRATGRTPLGYRSSVRKHPRSPGSPPRVSD